MFIVKTSFVNNIKQSWIVSRHCLGLSQSRDRVFDVSVSVSDPTVSVSVSRSFLDFLETVSKRKSCLLGNCLEAKVLFSCRSGLQSSRTKAVLSLHFQSKISKYLKILIKNLKS